VEQEGEEPQSLGADVNRPVDGRGRRRLRRVFRLPCGRQALFRVPEERPEAEDFERHPAEDAPGRRGVVETVRLDPGERAPLPRGRRDPEGDGRVRPADDAPDEPGDEHRQGRVGDADGEPAVRARRQPRQGQRDQDREDDDRHEKGHGGCFLLPRSLDQACHDGVSPKRRIGFFMSAMALTISSTSPP